MLVEKSLALGVWIEDIMPEVGFDPVLNFFSPMNSFAITNYFKLTPLRLGSVRQAP